MSYATKPIDILLKTDFLNNSNEHKTDVNSTISTRFVCNNWLGTIVFHLDPRVHRRRYCSGEKDQRTPVLVTVYRVIVMVSLTLIIQHSFLNNDDRLKPRFMVRTEIGSTRWVQDLRVAFPRIAVIVGKSLNVHRPLIAVDKLQMSTNSVLLVDNVLYKSTISRAYRARNP